MITMKAFFMKLGENIKRHPVHKDKQTRGKLGEFQYAPSCDLWLDNGKLKVRIQRWDSAIDSENPYNIKGFKGLSLPLDVVQESKYGNGFTVEVADGTYGFVSLSDCNDFEYHANKMILKLFMKDIQLEQAKLELARLKQQLKNVEEYAGVY